MVKVAMIQQQCSTDKEKNIDKALTYIREASSNGAKIICLQELFSTTYFCNELNEKYFNLAETIPGPTINRIADVAKAEGVVVIAPIYERVIDGELYNTATVIGPKGEIIGKYRKMSIPFVVSGSMKGMEKYYFKPGNLGFPVFQTPFGLRIGILICYDRHYPEAARALALAGADVVFIPTAAAGKTEYRKLSMWEIELKAHAVINIYYVGGVNRVNYDIGSADSQAYNGSSMFVTPKGEIISQAGDQNDEVIYGEIDPSVSAELRNSRGFYRDRRPDAYGCLSK